MCGRGGVRAKEEEPPKKHSFRAPSANARKRTGEDLGEVDAHRAETLASWSRCLMCFCLRGLLLEARATRKKEVETSEEKKTSLHTSQRLSRASPLHLHTSPMSHALLATKRGAAAAVRAGRAAQLSQVR